MASIDISNPLEWMSNPTKYFINKDELNHSVEQLNIEDIENFRDSYSGDIFGYARGIIKAITIAKQNNLLPEEIEKSTQNPEDAAQLATEGAVMMDTIVKLATGDIDTYEKLANRIIDTTHVLAVSSIEFVVQKGLPIVENSLATAAEAVGQAFGTPGVGQIVQQLFDTFAPVIRNKARAVLMAGCNKLHEFAVEAKNCIFSKIRKHRENRKEKQESKRKEKEAIKRKEIITSLA